MKALSLAIFLSFIYNTTYGQINPLTINDKLPNVQLTHLYNQQQKQLQLSDLKGQAILIDFWATWCSPCVSALPFMDTIQNQFKNKLTVICVTREDNKIVKEVLIKLFHQKQPDFTISLKDSILEQYFPHQTIPHCVWVDKEGVVKAITDKSSVTMKNIQSLINGESLQIVNKPSVIRYDKHKPPYASQQVKISDELLYHSMITKFREDLNTTYSRGINNDFISCINSSILRLYQCAFGKFDLSYWDMNRVICRGVNTFEDSVKIGLFKSDLIINKWHSDIKKNAFSYELATKDAIYSNTELFEIMLQDLNRYFSAYGITAHIEKKNDRVLALINLNTKDAKSYKANETPTIKYSGPGFLKIVNQPMMYFLSQIEPYMKLKKPIVNETGYDGNVNVDLNGDLSNLLQINKSLALYGLEFLEKDEPVDVIVITKTPNSKVQL